jgi:hypothetical protein
MSSHQTPEDVGKQIVLPPTLRAWFDRRRSAHLTKVRIHAECRNIADGTVATLAIFLAKGTAPLGAAIENSEGKISKGRLVGADGANGIEHELKWKLGAAQTAADGLVATVKVPAYAIAAQAPPLDLDLRPYAISG